MFLVSGRHGRSLTDSSGATNLTRLFSVQFKMDSIEAQKELIAQRYKARSVMSLNALEGILSKAFGPLNISLLVQEPFYYPCFLYSRRHLFYQLKRPLSSISESPVTSLLLHPSANIFVNIFPPSFTLFILKQTTTFKNS